MEQQGSLLQLKKRHKYYGQVQLGMALLNAVLMHCAKANFCFERVHADFLGPMRGYTILIITDTYSKWAFIMKRIDASTTIEKFREYFSRFGLLKTVVTDNGAQFTSGEFSLFLCRNSINHVTSPSHHPSTNGFAENAVISFKMGIMKAFRNETNDGCSFETVMNRYLFHYHNSIHSHWRQSDKLIV